MFVITIFPFPLALQKMKNSTSGPPIVVKRDNPPLHGAHRVVDEPLQSCDENINEIGPPTPLERIKQKEVQSLNSILWIYIITNTRQGWYKLCENLCWVSYKGTTLQLYEDHWVLDGSVWSMQKYNKRMPWDMPASEWFENGVQISFIGFTPSATGPSQLEHLRNLIPGVRTNRVVKNDIPSSLPALLKKNEVESSQEFDQYLNYRKSLFLTRYAPTTYSDKLEVDKQYWAPPGSNEFNFTKTINFPNHPIRKTDQSEELGIAPPRVDVFSSTFKTVSLGPKTASRLNISERVSGPKHWRPPVLEEDPRLSRCYLDEEFSNDVY